MSGIETKVERPKSKLVLVLALHCRVERNAQNAGNAKVQMGFRPVQTPKSGLASVLYIKQKVVDGTNDI